MSQSLDGTVESGAPVRRAADADALVEAQADAASCSTAEQALVDPLAAPPPVLRKRRPPSPVPSPKPWHQPGLTHKQRVASNRWNCDKATAKIARLLALGVPLEHLVPAEVLAYYAAPPPAVQPQEQPQTDPQQQPANDAPCPLCGFVNAAR